MIKLAVPIMSVILFFPSVALLGQVTMLSDPEVFPSSTLVLGFGGAPPGAPAAGLYQGAGVRFLSDGGGAPQIRVVELLPTIPPVLGRVLLNAGTEGSGENGALLILFDAPVRRLGMRLSNGDGTTTATLEAFSPAAVSLGSVALEGVDDGPPCQTTNCPVGVFVGLETSNAQGISTVTLRYSGDDPQEQIDDLRYEFVSPRPNLLFLPQVAVGGAEDLRIETVVQVQNLVGGSEATRVDFFDPEGDPMEVTADGAAVTSLEFGLAAGVSRIIHLSGQGAPRSGYGRVVSDRPFLAQTVYQVFRGDTLVTEAGVDAAPARYDQFLSFESEPSEGLELGLAVANPGTEPALVVLSLTDQAVTDILQADFTLQPGGHRSFFIQQLVAGLDGASFGGTVQISSSQPVVVTGLRTRDGLPSASLAGGGLER